ncbi:MAG: DUF362 domain-containing protein [Desulfobacterota bacterium]|jgi:uncharacterized protein (DUF362 family)|nr:DUF362 domain-containing protein [Thermodesulfobacteriota bacterium]
MEKHKVLIRRCDTYDPERIAAIVRGGMEELGIVPEGKVLLKPNVVMAHPEIFPHAFTRKEFLDGVLSAVRSRAGNLKELAVGERSGITIPTRFNFKMAGYPPVIRRHRARTYYFDEVRQVPVELKQEGRLRDLIFVPQPIRECDFLINLPKFKAHPWSRLTLSLKNFIGIQDDRHRLIDHTSFLEHKIADLQEVIQPRFIAIDAITAGQKMMLTPTPFDLGAIVMGSNSCAVDTVGCHMVGVNPQDLIHLKLTAERGFGPMDLDEIEVGGDFPLEEVREKTKNFQFCLERIDEYFPKTGNLTCTVGTFPEAHSADYCWGGCPGALQEAVHIFRGFDPETERKMKKIRYVVGRVEGPLHLAPDERVIFAGNCTSWEGNLDGEKVTIEPTYHPPAAVDARKTRSNDLLKKLAAALWDCYENRNSRYVRMKGCTLSVAEHVNYLSSLGKVKNPNFDPRLAIPVTAAYWRMRAARALNRLFG